METMRGEAATGAKLRAVRLKVVDVALLAIVFVPPTIVMTVYAMSPLNGHKPIAGYPWQLVAACSQSIGALTMRRVPRRVSPAGMAWLAVWFVLVAMSMTLFVQASAGALAVGIERAVCH